MRQPTPASASVSVGNYTHGFQTSRSRPLFVSGQIPEDASGNVPDRFEVQCELVWYDIGAVLELAKMTYAHLVKVTTFHLNRPRLTGKSTAPFSADLVLRSPGSWRGRSSHFWLICRASPCKTLN